MKSLVYLIFSLFTVSALSALPEEAVESAPPIFVEQEDGSLVLEHGTIAIEQTNGSIILAHGTQVDEGGPYPPRNYDKKRKGKLSIRERIIRIFLPSKKK